MWSRNVNMVGNPKLDSYTFYDYISFKKYGQEYYNIVNLEVNDDENTQKNA